MNEKPSIFFFFWISMLDGDSTFLFGILLHLKAVEWHTDICVVPQIPNPSGLADIQSDWQ